MEANKIKSGAHLFMHDGRRAIMIDDKIGIIRTIEIMENISEGHYNDVGSCYIDEISNVYADDEDNAAAPGSYDGEWRQVTFNTHQQRELKKVRH